MDNQDTGYWVLGTGYWSLGAGYWVLVTGFWSLGTGCWKKEPLPAVVANCCYGGVGSLFFYLQNRQNTSLIQYQASSIQHHGQLLVQRFCQNNMA